MSVLANFRAIAKAYGALDPRDQVAILAELAQHERDEISRAALEGTKNLRFIPNLGPQSAAYFSLADLLGYGGEPGGGKSALGVGLAFNEHHFSLIIRRRFVQLEALTKIAIAFNGGKSGYAGGNRPKLSFTDGRTITFGANQHLGDEWGYQGDPYDFKYYDEGVQLLEQQIRYHGGWMRRGPGVPPKQRIREVIGTNPPLDASGDWMVKVFRPWLDLTHPKPAKDGELRFYIVDKDGLDVEVEGPEPVEREGKTYRPKSRTFIRAHLEDNPYLVRDDEYRKQLDGLPEPLRTTLRSGNFMAARLDAPNQVIPMAWILAAQERWKPDGWKQFEMTALALDPAGGGNDAEEIMARHGAWFAQPHSTVGLTTAQGEDAAARVFKVRKHGCPIIVDVGGGYGGAPITVFKQNRIEPVRFDGGGKSMGVSRDGAKLKFKNKRAESWWRMREALNPEQEGGSDVALPPHPEVRADLAAPTYEIVAGVVTVEPKDDIRERIGRSTGKGDAAVMALAEGDQAVKRQLHNRPRQLQTRANVGYPQLKKAG